MNSLKRRRIFLAINLPDQVKKKLLSFQRDWSTLPVRWTRDQNLHITLIFIGYVDDEQMLDICQLTRQITKKSPCFEITLNKICFGPPNRPARMIWAMGEKDPVLSQLKKDLEEKLFNSESSGYDQRQAYPYRPHITLARIRQDQWRSLPDIPKIDKDISLTFSVDSIEVMQSRLSRSGADYAVLESVELSS